MSFVSSVLCLFLWYSSCSVGVLSIGVRSVCVVSLEMLFVRLIVSCMVGWLVVVCMLLGISWFILKMIFVCVNVVCLVLVIVMLCLVGCNNWCLSDFFSLCICVLIVCMVMFSWVVVCVKLFFFMMI